MVTHVARQHAGLDCVRLHMSVMQTDLRCRGIQAEEEPRHGGSERSDQCEEGGHRADHGRRGQSDQPRAAEGGRDITCVRTLQRPLAASAAKRKQPVPVMQLLHPALTYSAMFRQRVCLAASNYVEVTRGYSALSGYADNFATRLCVTKLPPSKVRTCCGRSVGGSAFPAKADFSTDPQSWSVFKGVDEGSTSIADLPCCVRRHPKSLRSALLH